MQRRRDPERHLVAAVADDGGARPVQREFQQLRQAGQGLRPVVELEGVAAAGGGLLAEQVALPQGVVGVLDRQRRCGGRGAGQAGRVGGGQVAGERAPGPAVAGDVVQHQQQHVPVGREPEQGGAQRQFGGQVEAGRGLRGQQGVQLGLVGVHHPQLRAGLVRRQDLLPGHAAGLGVAGAQRLVAFGHVGECGAQRGLVQVAGQPQAHRDVVGRAGALHPVQEPQPLLGGGERDRLGPRPGQQGRADALGVADDGRQGGDGGGLEQVADGEFGAEDGPDPADQPGGEQRVPAEFEEVAVDADPGQAEDLGEQRAEHLLAPVARGLAGRVAGPVGRGQRPAVELAVGGERQGVEHHVRGGHLVRREQLLGVGADGRDQLAGAVGAGGVVGQRGERGVRACGRTVGVGPGGGAGQGEHDVQGALVAGGPGDGGPVAEPGAERVQLLRVGQSCGGGCVEPGEGGGGVGVGERRAGLVLLCQAEVGHPGDPQPLGPSLPQQCGELVRAGQVGAPGEAVLGEVPGGGGAGAQHHVVAVPVHLVVVAAAADLDPDAGDGGRGGGEDGEVVRVEEQFGFAGDALLDAAGHRGAVREGTGAAQFDGGAEGLQQAAVADVADEDRAAGGEQVEDAGEHLGEVGGVGEVLDHGVENHRVEVAAGQAVEDVRGLRPQLDPSGQVGAGVQLLAQPVDDGRGDVGAPVLLAVAGQRGEDQPGAAADLQHPARGEGADPFDAVLPPPVHLLDGDGCAGVAGVPAGEVVAEGAVELAVVAVVGLLPAVQPALLAPGVAALGGVGGHQVGDQPAVAVVLGGEHGRLSDGGVGHQGGLHLAGLDPEPADLHLVVGAAGELQLAGGGPARQVPGAVHPAAGRAERVGHEAGGRQRRPVQVPAGQAAARQVQLPGHARRHRPQGGVQHVDPGAGDRAADRRYHGAGQGPAHGGADRGLGGAVRVGHPPSRGPAFDLVGCGGLAGHHQVQAGRQGAVGEDREGGRGQGGEGGAGPGDQLGEGRSGPQLLGGGHHQGGARQQAQGDLPQGRVEADRGELQDPAARSQPELPDQRHQDGGDAAVRHRDALRLPG